MLFSINCKYLDINILLYGILTYIQTNNEVPCTYIDHNVSSILLPFITHNISYYKVYLTIELLYLKIFAGTQKIENIDSKISMLNI